MQFYDGVAEGGTQSDVYDEQYRTEPHTGTFHIQLSTL